MKRLPDLKRNSKGAAAIEFAIAAPVFVLLLMGMAQFSLVLFAQAGLDNAVTQAARQATLYRPPMMTEAQREQEILDELDAGRFGLAPERLSDPVIAYGTSNGSPYAEITLSYTMPLAFGFYTMDPITLTETRRAFVQTTN